MPYEPWRIRQPEAVSAGAANSCQQRGDSNPQTAAVKLLTLQGLSAIKPLSPRACPALSWLDSASSGVTLLLTALLLPKCKLICRQEEQSCNCVGGERGDAELREGLQKRRAKKKEDQKYLRRAKGSEGGSAAGLGQTVAGNNATRSFGFSHY